MVVFWTTPVRYLLIHRGGLFLQWLFSAVCLCVISSGLDGMTEQLGQVRPLGVAEMMTYALMHQNSAVWMVQFIAATNTRLLLAAYWGLILVLGLAAMHDKSPLRQLPRLDQRKYFHLVAFLLFVPVRSQS